MPARVSGAPKSPTRPDNLIQIARSHWEALIVLDSQPVTLESTTTAPRGAPQLSHLLEGTDRFLVAVEIETTRGLTMEEPSSKTVDLAHQLADYDEVDLVCLTDNPGGHPQVRPEVLGQQIMDRGGEVVINFACKDYNRNGIESRLWALGSTGFRNILALSGDYPAEGYAGQAQPVFDIDSVGLLEMIRQMNAGLFAPARRAGDGADQSQITSFYPGVAVNPFKRHESEYMPQLFKLALKIRTGARWAITQIGYDSRKLDDLARYMRLHEMDVPLIGSIFILSAPAARFFNRWGIPGVAATDELRLVAERQGASPDKGRQFFLEFAARQLAVLRGLGYRGVYLSGRPSIKRVEKILEIERSFGQKDWEDFAREIHYPQPEEFYYFEENPDTGLASDTVNRQYAASKSRGARLKRRLSLPLSYRLGRLAHGAVFDSDSLGFKIGRAVYRRVDRSPKVIKNIFHAAEQATKVPVYGCKDCGDCSLPDIAYLCPESQCVKNQRNGPCGGTHDGYCEVLDKECIWSRAYDRLKAHGEEERMLERPVVFKNGALQGTSAWANTFLGRDHNAAGKDDDSRRRE